MAFIKGQKKVGGRTKGIPNIRDRVINEIFDQYKFDPADHILKHMAELDIRDQVQVCVALLPYIYSKRESDSVNVLMVLQKFGVEAIGELADKDLNEAIAGVATRPKALPTPLPSQTPRDPPSGEKT